MLNIGKGRRIGPPEQREREGDAGMGSFHPPKNYHNKTRIDLNQSYQVAYWKERFQVSEEELGEAVRAAGASARKVEAYLKAKTDR
jgi:hypothetical protein